MSQDNKQENTSESLRRSDKKISDNKEQVTEPVKTRTNKPKNQTPEIKSRKDKEEKPKPKKNEFITYIFFGVLTTLVFLIVKAFSYEWTKSGAWSEVIAQTISIIFAFITNKIWVFPKTNKNVFREFLEFVIARLFMMGMATLANWYFIDKRPEIITDALHISVKTSVSLLTLLIQVITVLFNYLVSKFLVFRQKSSKAN
jgi:Predicted membrane protein